MSEPLREDLLRSLDRPSLARMVGITQVEPWQEKVLESRSKRILLNCARQSGKSTLMALLTLHEALYHPGSLCLVIAPTLRQSRLTFRTAVDGYRRIGRPIETVTENQLEVELESGSRIIAIPGGEEGSRIRGFADVALLCIDEAGWVSDDTFFSVLPMLGVSGGRIVASSTPNGAQGWWWSAWSSAEAGESEWELHRVAWDAIPHLNRELVSEAKRTMTARRFEQEYMGEFRDAAEQVFASHLVDAAFDPTLEPLPIPRFR